MAVSRPAEPAGAVRRTPRKRRGAGLSPALSRIHWIAIALLLPLPLFGGWLYGSVRFWAHGPQIVLACLSALVLLIGCLPRFKREVLRRPPGFVPFLLFLALAWIMIPFAAVPFETRQHALRFTSFLAAYWVWVEVGGRRDRWRLLLSLMLISVILMALYALVQHGRGSRMVLAVVRPENYFMRASGAYICPNHFANMLNLFLPVCLVIAFSRSFGVVLRLLAGYAALVSIPAVYLTQSRSGWIGFFAGVGTVLLVLALTRSVKKFVITAVVLPVAVAAIAVTMYAVSPMIQERVAEAAHGNIRIQLWQDTWSIITAQPWFGYGLGSYRWVYPHVQQHMIMYVDPEYAHNDYLHFWAETGLVGIALLAWGFGAIVWRTLRAAVTGERRQDVLLTAGLAGSLAAVFSHNLFDFNFNMFGNVHILIFLTGILTSATFGCRADRGIPFTSPWLRRIVVGAGCLYLAFAVVVTTRAYLAERIWKAGDAAKESLEYDRAESLYRRAASIEPGDWNPHLHLAHMRRGQSFWNRSPERKQEQIDEARVLYARSIELNPWDTEADYGLSALFNMTGEPEKALEIRRELVERVPMDLFYRKELGLQLRSMGRYEEALKVFEEAKKLKTDEQIELNIRMLQRKLESAAGGRG